jgi:hypothetical protein
MEQWYYWTWNHKSIQSKSNNRQNTSINEHGATMIEPNGNSMEEYANALIRIGGIMLEEKQD